MSSQVTQIDFDVRGLFLNTTAAVVTTQKQLDGEMSLDYIRTCPHPDQRMLFSVPRADATLRFGVEETASKTWRLLPRRSTNAGKQRQTHELEFSVVAVTERPSLLLAAEQTRIPIFLSQPYFLLTSEDEAALMQRLIAALTPETRSWRAAIPPGGITPEKLQKVVEGEFDGQGNLKTKGEKHRIVDALKPENALDERGMVAFRLESSPVSFLVVRVVGKDANDSVFVVTPGKQPEVVIYSVDRDESKSIRFGPLFQLMQTIRRCQQGALKPTFTQLSEQDITGPANNGLAPLLPFAKDVRDGYEAAVSFLAQPDNESFMQVRDVQLTTSLYYDVTDVKAALTYSLGYENDNEVAQTRFDFQLRTDPRQNLIDIGDKASETKLIESRAVISVERPTGKPAAVKVELNTPEFVLSGSARERLLKLARKSIDAIAGAFEPNQQDYRGFLANESFQGGAVAFLSYRGKQPKEQFLVIWPGAFLGRSRDFAFTCKVDQKDRSRLTEIKAVLRVEQDLTGVELSNVDPDEDPVSGEQYRAFHNFFHAVRIWRARMIGRVTTNVSPLNELKILAPAQFATTETPLA